MNNAPGILVFGATSAICHALLKRYAADQARFFLVGRDRKKLRAVADDLEARGGELVGSADYNFSETAQHTTTVRSAVQALGALDLVVVAHGTLPEQADCESSSSALTDCMQDNFVSAATIMQVSAQQLAAQATGTLAVISSVAGDRGRKSNYTYGAAKAGIDAFVQGLQGRFAGSEVKVVNIKPGMVKSPMTADIQHGLIWSTPEAIAPSMYTAIRKGKRVVYVPGFWRLIMLVIRYLPTAVLARLPI